MCTVCGCSQETTEGFHEHVHADGSVERHANHSPSAVGDHDHAHGHADHTHMPPHAHGVEQGTLRLDRGPAGTEVPGMSQRRLVAVEASILGKNDALAAQNRERFVAANIASLNLISSPGAGKTTLLVETLKRLAGRPMAVIEGDQQTNLDAERIRQTGVKALQINTGKGCHLDAQMVQRAFDALEVPRDALLFIENVGNLVCPSGFDLGEAKRVALLSITEGEDKPLKYPNAFAGADLVLITKLDLQPLVQADLEALRANLRKVQPDAEVIELSARSGAGFEAWLAWLSTLTESPPATASAR